MSWSVICEPVGENPGVVKRAAGAVTGSESEPENIGGIVIYVTNGASKQEVSRVAWVRRASVCKNPKTSFEKQLDKEITKARAAVEALNNQFVSSGEMQ